MTARSTPTDLPERLRREGYKVVEEAEVLAWELRDAHHRPRLPKFRSVEGISIGEVRTDIEFGNFHALSTAIFGDPKPSEEAEAAFRKDFHRKVKEEGHSDRFLACLGTQPIGRAGLEIAGDVARLWGTGVLPEFRGRGVYGALVLARCEEAIRRGATLALVTARTGTSGPILKHHGFRTVGVLRIFEARW